MAGKTTNYLRSHPAAKAKQDAYRKKYNATKDQIDYRSELIKLNREKGEKGDGKDVSHVKDKKGKSIKTVLADYRENRRGKGRHKKKKRNPRLKRRN